MSTKLKIGDKVKIPTRKTSGCSFETFNSKINYSAIKFGIIKRNAEYGYAVTFPPSSDTWDFHGDDLVPYDVKIIGYKAPYDIYMNSPSRNQVKKGDVLTSGLGFMYGTDSMEPQFKLPKEIVETWEPVYEEEKPIKIGGFKAEKVNGYIKFGCQEFTPAFLETVKVLVTNKEIKGKLTVHDIEITEELINKLLNM